MTFGPLELPMLHKMYLILSNIYQKRTATKKLLPKIKRRRNLQQSDYDKWIKMRGKLREE